MMVVAIMFVIISLTIVFGIITPVLAQIKNASRALASREVYFLAEASTEDVLYRMKNGMNVSSTETLTINGNSAETTITDLFDSKVIATEAEVKDYVRKVQAEIITGEGVAFNYALQSGNGGFYMSGGGTVNGNVYSNGNIVGASGVTIDGSATAASSPPGSPIQYNNSPTVPSSSITFGSSNSSQDFAQSFAVEESGSPYKISLYIKKNGNPSNITLKIAFDNNGSPGTVISGSDKLLSAGVIGSSYGWVDVVFDTAVLLQPDVTYWIVLDKANNNGSYTIGANTAYASGIGKVGRFNSSWNSTNPANLDGYFEIYVGGTSSKIEGEGGSQWYQPLNINGDSWAETVNYTNTAGVIYCENSNGNASGKDCDTSRGYPSPQSFPVSDSNIQSWKDEVWGVVQESDSWEQSDGFTVPWNGYTKNNPLKVNGNLSVRCNDGYQASFKDLEITGNLSIGSSCTMVIDGVLKVGGSFSMSGGSTNILMPSKTVWIAGDATFSTEKVKLHPSYGSDSGVILVEGRVSLGGSIDFEGSGFSGSYPIIVTTSSCPFDTYCDGDPALSVAGSAGAVVVVAPYGVLELAGGSGVKAVVAHKVVIEGSGTINYDSGLADMTLNSGPSGGWNIQSWKEVE